METTFTSTSFAGGIDGVWIAPFNGNDGRLGVLTPVDNPASSAAVRCVRTETAPSYPLVARALEGDYAERVLIDPDLMEEGRQKMLVHDDLYCRWMVVSEAALREASMLYNYGSGGINQYVWNRREETP